MANSPWRIAACVALPLALAPRFARADARLTNDSPASAGYVSADTLAGLPSYTDVTLQECSRSRGRQNEPAVALDPRNPDLIVGSSNDYCGVYDDGVDDDGAPIPSGPVWLGYYRSEDGGATFRSSLVPGYPADTSTLGALARVRTATAGDPVLAWDAEGRLFMGAESSGDPAGSKKTFGDVWVARYVNPDGPSGNSVNDGKRFAGSVIVARGSSAPNLLGKFQDKTAIEVDRTSSACAGTVYFAWSRFTGGSAIYLARSTDHGASFSTPSKLTESVHVVQGPDIAVTGNGHVYVTYRQFAVNGQPEAISVVRSTDCGATFGQPQVLAPLIPYEYGDRHVTGGLTGDCGDGDEACVSGYTYFRNGTLPRSTADQGDTEHEWVHVVYEATVPGTVVPTGTTFGSIGTYVTALGQGGQGSVYYLRYDGASGAVTPPSRIDAQPVGHQLFPDVVASAGTLHAIWWDSRNDVMNDAASFRLRPIGNDADGDVGPALDVFAATKPAAGGAWSPSTRLTDVTSNPNYEQFSNRQTPFAGDYLWVDSQGGRTFATWTDWRDTVPGTDPREATPDEAGADVRQCRNPLPDGSFTNDLCPRDGGLDQNIYGDQAP